MTTDVSASGISLIIKASKTFPQGFTVTQFADDADPLDIPALTLSETAMNVNGELVSWSSPQPIVVTVNLIPGSDDDNNMSILFEANRAAGGRTIARDLITMVSNYPDGSTVTLSNGKMTSGFPGKSIASAGRMKSKAYVFTFQDISVARGTGQ